MRERFIAAILTLALISGAVWWSQRKERSLPPSADSAIWAVIEASRKGDLRRYLDCFTGKLRERLEKILQEQGADAFRRYLSQSLVLVKGVSVFAPEPQGQNQWQVRVDFVFADHTETQTYQVVREGTKWRIIDVTTARSIPVLIPYGAFVFSRKLLQAGNDLY